MQTCEDCSNSDALTNIEFQLDFKPFTKDVWLVLVRNCISCMHVFCHLTWDFSFVQKSNLWLWFCALIHLCMYWGFNVNLITQCVPVKLYFHIPTLAWTYDLQMIHNEKHLQICHKVAMKLTNCYAHLSAMDYRKTFFSIPWMLICRHSYLNASLQSVVRKGQGLNGPNDWRSCEYIWRFH